MSDGATAVVPVDLDGVRIDRALAVLGGLTRAQTRAMIESKDVLLNGAEVRRSTLVASGDVIEYTILEVGGDLIPEPVAFTVVADSDDILVIDKPAGVVVHPGAGNQTGTLAHGLAHQYADLARLGIEHRWGLVHRLDRETSGLLLVARTVEMHEYLQEELRNRTISRTYLALVLGHLDAATGTIEAPIGRDPLRPTRMAVVRDGRPSRTHYRRLAEWSDCTLVEIHLETGRTHQIRVHFSSIGHGVVGDRIYAEREVAGGDPGRVWLHSIRLRFTLPGGEEREAIAALPDDLRASLRELGEPSSGELPAL